MKRTKRKLSVAKETLRKLDERELRAVGGGSGGCPDRTRYCGCQMCKAQYDKADK